MIFPCLSFFANCIKLNLASGNIIPQKFLSLTNPSSSNYIICSWFILLRNLYSFLNSLHSLWCRWLILWGTCLITLLIDKSVAEFFSSNILEFEDLPISLYRHCFKKPELGSKANSFIWACSSSSELEITSSHFFLSSSL